MYKENLAELEENVVEEVEEAAEEEVELEETTTEESKEVAAEAYEEQTLEEDVEEAAEEPQEETAIEDQILAEATETYEEETLEEDVAVEEPAKDDLDNMTEEEVDEFFDMEKEYPSTEEISEELVEEEVDEEDDDGFPDLDFGSITAIEHPTKSAVGGSAEASDFRIINTPKSGKRIVLKPSVVEKLELEDTLEVGLFKNTVVLAKSGISDKIKYNLRKQKNTYVIYNTKLIEDITKALDLEFENISTVNLKVKYTKRDGKTILMARK